MSVPRSLPVFLSVIFTAGLWVYGAVFLQTGGRHGVYAALVCGDAYSDSEIRDRLDGQGFTGLVSESDQWFLLDCFGYVEKVPLVEYEERLLPFDPRNDGYAQKLKKFFVRDGKRFIYIPLAANHPENMETKIARALNGIPYSLDYSQGAGRSNFLPFMMFCLAACAFFAIPALRRLLNARLFTCLPVLSPLALGMAPGFALVSLLAGFAALLNEQQGRKTSAFSRLWQKYGLSGPFNSRWLPACALVACYVFLSFLSGLSVHFTFIVLVLFCCVFAVSRINDEPQSARGGFSGRINFKKIDVNRLFPPKSRFMPVEILSRRKVTYNFFPVMLPFAAMALALAFAGFAKPQSAPAAPSAAPLPSGLVSEADFREHFFFQHAFSLMALGKPYAASEGLPAGKLPVIAGYELSSNGLIDPAATAADNEPPTVPDFPLGGFLRALGSKSQARVKSGNAAPVDLLLSLLPVLFILPAFINQKKEKRQGGQTLFSLR